MKIIYYILTILLLGACQQGEEGFVVKGTIKGYTGTKLYVREIIPENNAWFNDTIQVVNGNFEFKGSVETPRLVYFIPQDFQGRYELFLENSEIELSVVNGCYREMKVTGSKNHDEFLHLSQAAKNMLLDYYKYEERKNLGYKNDQESYQRLVDSTDIWLDRLLVFLMCQNNYKESQVLPYLASEWIKGEDIERMEKFLEGLDENAKNNVYARHCAKVLGQAKKVRPGNLAYNFTLQDIEGREYRLSDYKGNYVLLEFSASWCGWCKLELPFLKQVYELTKGSSFKMFTINLDKEKNLWEEDVKKENLPWPVLSDLRAFEGDVARQYNVSGIPVIYLIDPEGKIVSNKLRGENMIALIRQLVLNYK